MRLVLLAILSVVACASAAKVQSLIGYHERIGIPIATEIKAAEDAHFAHQNLFARIFGGVFAKTNSHPYLGGLLVNFVNHPGTGVCGSSLVSLNRLVTAAHCWFDGRLQASHFVVVLGSAYLFSGGDRITTSTIATHPGWNPVTWQNDVAVIYLQNPVLFTSNVQPIALARNQSESFEGQWATAVGFGKIKDEQIGVPALSMVSEVNMKVISVQQCQAVYGPFVQPTNICTDGADGVGICAGDSGGPLIVNGEAERVLIAIGSFVAAAGCERGHPSGFSRVTAFTDFITQHL